MSVCNCGFGELQPPPLSLSDVDQEFNQIQLQGLVGGTGAEFIGRRITTGPLMQGNNLQQFSLHSKHGEAKVKLLPPSGRGSANNFTQQVNLHPPDKGLAGVIICPSLPYPSKFRAYQVYRDGKTGKVIGNTNNNCSTSPAPV